MKNKFKKFIRKYENIKISVFEGFKSRKNKIKGIWNSYKTNTGNNHLTKKKKNKKNSLLPKINFANFKSLKIYDSFFIKKSHDNSKVKVNKKKKSQNIKLTKNEETNFFNRILSENLQISFKNLNKIPSREKLNFKISIPTNLKKFLKENLRITSNKKNKDSFKSTFKFKNIEKLIEQSLKIKIPSSIKSFYTNNVSKNIRDKDIKYNFLGIYYVNNKLYFAHIQKKNKLNIIRDIIKINTPGDLIGNYKIEKIPEVARIVKDICNVFELKNPPIILLLSSSFFTVRSFSDSELVVFSDEDPLILAKSPFLPDNTLVQYKRVSGDKTSSYHRVVYAEKEVIDSWINVISLVGFEIATVTCPAIHLVEKLSEKQKKEICILCDIEDFNTSVYFLKNNCQLLSTKLPFGTSYYITDKESLNGQFFSRLKNSVKLITADNKLEFDDNIYLTGNGLDKMLSKNNTLSVGFLKASENKFKFEKQKESNLYSESILNFFSDTIEILIKEEEKKVISNKQQTYRGQKYEQKKDQKVVSKNKQNSLTYRGKDYKG